MLDTLVILLAGRLLESELSARLGMPVPGLPLDPRRTLLQVWLDLLNSQFRLSETDVILLCARESDRQWYAAEVARSNHRAAVRVALDPRPHRGVAGLLRDAHERFGDGRPVLSLEISSLPPESLAPVLDALDADTSLVVSASTDRRPAGVFAIRPGVFDMVPRIGYVDLKEQMIPKCLASGHRVALATCTSTAIRISDRKSYLRALQVWLGRSTVQPNQLQIAGVRVGGASLICDGATLGEDCTVIDSAIFPGAELGRGSVVARSIIGPMIKVPEDTVVVDGVIGAMPFRSEIRATSQSLAREGGVSMLSSEWSQ